MSVKRSLEVAVMAEMIRPGQVLDIGCAGIINAGSSAGHAGCDYLDQPSLVHVRLSFGCPANLRARPQPPSGTHAGVSVIAVATADASTKPSEQRAPDDSFRLPGAIRRTSALATAGSPG
jgi:hypothetical protein